MSEYTSMAALRTAVAEQTIRIALRGAYLAGGVGAREEDLRRTAKQIAESIEAETLRLAPQYGLAPETDSHESIAGAIASKEAAQFSAVQFKYPAERGQRGNDTSVPGLSWYDFGSSQMHPCVETAHGKVAIEDGEWIVKLGNEYHVLTPGSLAALLQLSRKEELLASSLPCIPNVDAQIDGLNRLQAEHSAKSVAMASQVHDDYDRDIIVKRTRRLARLAGIPTALPEDDVTVYGALFTCLGMVAQALERQATAHGAQLSGQNLTPDEIEAGMQAFIASGGETIFEPAGLQAVFDAVLKVRGIAKAAAPNDGAVLWGYLQERSDGDFRAIKLDRLASSDASWGWRATSIFVEPRTAAEKARAVRK